jgi:acetyltransferase-like isoleucine patch superfamily enzyme
MMMQKAKNLWERYWMHLAGTGPLGRTATWLATWFSPTYFGRHHLASMNKKGYISPWATIHHDELSLGGSTFIDDQVIIYKYKGGGPVHLSRSVSLHRDCIIQTGAGGSVSIGSDTHIQPRCIFSAFMSPIVIGSGVQIAPNCAFYPYDHSTATDKPMKEQPLRTKGGIFIGDDVWLGVGVIVLDGVRIGAGAVIGAGSVVTRDIPKGAVAVGNPARVKKMRSDLQNSHTKRLNQTNMDTNGEIDEITN